MQGSLLLVGGRRASLGLLLGPMVGEMLLTTADWPVEWCCISLVLIGPGATRYAAEADFAQSLGACHCSHAGVGFPLLGW